MIGIYQIRNIKTNKVYIGSSINIEKRWKQHIYELNGNKHHSLKLQRSWNKSGQENFVFEVLELTNNQDKERLFQLEQLYLDKFKPHETGYNIQPEANKIIDVKAKNKRDQLNKYNLLLEEMKIKYNELIMDTDLIHTHVSFLDTSQKVTKNIFNNNKAMYESFPFYQRAVIDHIYPLYNNDVIDKITVKGRVIGSKDYHRVRYYTEATFKNGNTLYHTCSYGELIKYMEKMNIDNYYDMFIYFFKIPKDISDQRGVLKIHIFEK